MVAAAAAWAAAAAMAVAAMAGPGAYAHACTSADSLQVALSCLEPDLHGRLAHSRVRPQEPCMRSPCTVHQELRKI